MIGGAARGIEPLTFALRIRLCRAFQGWKLRRREGSGRADQSRPAGRVDRLAAAVRSHIGPVSPINLRAARGAELPRQEGCPYVLTASLATRPGGGRTRRRRIHDLRHSFASISVSGGDSLYLVGKVLGHRQSPTTERYTHLKYDPLRAVANRTSERIAAIMQGSRGTGPVSLPSSRSGE